MQKKLIFFKKRISSVERLTSLCFRHSFSVSSLHISQYVKMFSHRHFNLATGKIFTLYDIESQLVTSTRIEFRLFISDILLYKKYGGMTDITSYNIQW